MCVCERERVRVYQINRDRQTDRQTDREYLTKPMQSTDRLSCSLDNLPPSRPDSKLNCKKIEERKHGWK